MSSRIQLLTKIALAQNTNIFGDELSGFGFADVSPEDAQARLDAAADLAPPGTIPILDDAGEIALVPETRGDACANGKGSCNNRQECQDQGGDIFQDNADECAVDGFDEEEADAAADDINQQLADQGL